MSVHDKGQQQTALFEEEVEEKGYDKTNIKETSHHLVQLLVNPETGLGMTGDQGRQWLNRNYKVDSPKKMNLALMHEAIHKLEEAQELLSENIEGI